HSAGMSSRTQTRLGWRARIREAEVSRRAVGYVRAHPVWSIFLLALVARVAVSVGLAVFHPGNIAPDGIEYSRLAADKATGHTGYWDTYLHDLYHQVRTLLVPLVALYKLFGAHQLIGQLYVSLLGAGTAAITTRLAMEALP